MNVMTVNVGSASIRLHLYSITDDDQPELRASRTVARDDSWQARVQAQCDFFATIGVPICVAHRFVQGGPRLRSTCRIDDHIKTELGQYATWAPLHTPAALQWVNACSEALGAHVPQYAVFDTAFFADLPPRAAKYALPLSLAENYGILRYGFHGLAHQSMWEAWCTVRPELPNGGRLVSLQLGSGCSAVATLNGKAMDTSMGFSPMEGLVMATRCGDIDASVLLHLQRVAHMSPNDVEDLLMHQSGLLGLSGTADMAALLRREDSMAHLATEIFCYRAAKYVAAFSVALGGIDGLIFGGGIGENAPAIRQSIGHKLTHLGLSVDGTANRSSILPRCISSNQNPNVWVVPVDEACLLAREAVQAMRS